MEGVVRSRAMLSRSSGSRSRSRSSGGSDSRINYEPDCYITQLLEKLEQRGVTHFDDVYQEFTAEEIKTFIIRIGLKWRSIAKQKIASMNMLKLEKEKNQSYLRNLESQPHLCKVEETKEIGTVHRRRDFNYLVNRTVALMRDPIVTKATKNDYKCLLGGDRLEVNASRGARHFLPRIPVIATASRELCDQLTSVDKADLYSCIKQYNLHVQINSVLVRGAIPECPVTLCACHLRELFKRYDFY
ncbi:unnamed protein product [Rodentolepis nana]|uniref:SAM domain-containing protein n=1 Tax=Rodentolepis nana TaxID=102285 RepID=A0A0R3TQ70_RODNA|nr:unnamed protein product [Rodentolepis nana]